MGTGVPFPGGKARPGSDADNSLPSSSAQAKNKQEVYISSPQLEPVWQVAGQLYFTVTNYFSISFIYHVYNSLKNKLLHL
jgi:hypothetical protein